METTEKRIYLNADQAKSLLSDQDFIHTFRNPRGMMIGCDWSKEKLIQAIDEAPENHIEIGGELCMRMGHGLVIYIDGPLFVEVDKDQIKKLESELL